MLSDPDIISDTNRFMELSKEEGQLRETVEVLSTTKTLFKKSQTTRNC
ncbi:Peptide chain release factor 1 [Weissella viridescens]|uniref:Peptide chain release factor 1 n=1 Tax=Weissella viridescens TaxID=1629 RepID=A0A380NYA9_WEIVI|nr:Peptide chain release factor 1 [Weissella viridescens]